MATNLNEKYVLGFRRSIDFELTDWNKWLFSALPDQLVCLRLFLLGSHPLGA